jgi:hypothetical protein
VRIFLTKWMSRFVRRERIDVGSLLQTIARAERGAVDADLGGGLIKQRLARSGAGRSGGYRTIIAYRVGTRVVFLYGFAKNARENIGDDDLRALRHLGANWLGSEAATIIRALEEGALTEIEDDDGQS